MDEIDHGLKETTEKAQELIQEIRGSRTWTRKRFVLILISLIGLFAELFRCVYTERDRGFEQLFHFGYQIIHEYFNCSNGDRI